jgi:hypothetical protein
MELQSKSPLKAAPLLAEGESVGLQLGDAIGDEQASITC